MKAFLWCAAVLSLLLSGCSTIANHPKKTPTNSTSSAVVVQAQATWLTPNVVKHTSTDNQVWVANPNTYQTIPQTVVNPAISVPILEYHEANYVPGDIATLKPGQFLSEIQWLHAQGFHTINFGQLYAAMYHGYQLPSKPILLSFDDGYESVYLRVFPILKKYQDMATLFIVTGFTHTSPNRNKKFPTLTTSELQQMQQSSLVDIECHTVSHRDLATLSDPEATFEIEHSAQILQSIVHHPMLFFCYPDGGYTKQTLAIMSHSGYLLAVTQHQGYAQIGQGPLTLHRITILDTTNLHDFANLLRPSFQ